MEIQLNIFDVRKDHRNLHVVHLQNDPGKLGRAILNGWKAEEIKGFVKGGVCAIAFEFSATEPEEPGSFRVADLRTAPFHHEGRSIELATARMQGADGRIFTLDRVPLDWVEGCAVGGSCAVSAKPGPAQAGSKTTEEKSGSGNAA